MINAAGFYGGQISAMAGIDAPLAVLEHQYVVSAPVPQLESTSENFPLVRDPELMFYLRREQNRLLFGNYGHEGRTVWENGLPDAFDSSLFGDSTEDVAEAAERAMAHVPILGEVGITEFVNGPIAYSPDANPLVGPAPGVRNFYQAIGVQIGITHAAAAGKVLTEMITCGDTEWDVWTWDPRRFGDWAQEGSGRHTYANTRARELYELQYAEAFPHRVWTSARPVNQSPLYATLAAKGARFGQVAGWERAFWFGAEPYDHAALSYRDEQWHSTVAGECLAVRDHVGVMDHCGFTRFEVDGPGAAAFLDRMFCTRLPEVGRVRLSYMLRPNGTVWSEATIGRIAENRFLLLGPTAARERDFDWLAGHLPTDGSVALRHGAERTSALMVMGPRSRDLLSRLTDADLSRRAAPWMSLREIEVAGIKATALRVSFVGELGWELHVDDIDVVDLYAALHSTGADLGLRDFGSYALDAMRIEKAYHGWGTEFGVEYTPFEAGLERFVDLQKPEFIGREAAREASIRPHRWSYGVWTVDLDGINGPPGDPAPSAPIRVHGRTAGFVTSASLGFRTGQRVCLGYIEERFAAADTGFTVDVFGADCPAERHNGAVYDPTNERPRS